VEVDGQAHGFDAQAADDRWRDQWLAENGIRVLRLPATVVLKEMGAAIRIIEAAATDLPPPSPGRGKYPA
jgi:very-short-patch-repair endonuclease